MVNNVNDIPRDTALRPSGAASEWNGLYFKTISNSPVSAQVGQIADHLYQKILADAKLTQVMQRAGQTQLYLYQSRAEYLEKSKMPAWSDGVFTPRGIIIYLHPKVPETLAHEITHLIFWEFFGEARAELLWLNEGLAMHEEAQARPERTADAYKSALPVLKGHYLPLAKLTGIASAIKHKNREAHIFYVESWLLVRFLLERGGNVGFYEFLKALKEHAPLDEAIRRAFPGKWNNLDELEMSFRNEYSAVLQ